MSGAPSDPQFDGCFAITLGHEGGLVDDPADPGGLTNWGISQRAYPNTDIRALTQDGAKALYYPDYYLKAQCNKLPPALAVVVFDAAVNTGTGAASLCIKGFQEALGVTADGIVGPQTSAALAKADMALMVSYGHGARIQYMAGLGNWPTYAKGWSRRLAQIPYQAAQLAVSLGAMPPTV